MIPADKKMSRQCRIFAQVELLLASVLFPTAYAVHVFFQNYLLAYVFICIGTYAGIMTVVNTVESWRYKTEEMQREHQGMGAHPN